MGVLGIVLAGCSGAPPPAAPPTPEAPKAWNHEWVRGAVFYEVFVRSFEDSNGDGIGDLNGLTSRLDALNDGKPAISSDLGVDALWLTPIFASPSYHGYDTTDYEHIDPAYGTEADFDRLLAEAHKRGIRVILDLVLNHTSSQHPWFHEADTADTADTSPTAPRRDWYVWRPSDLGWTQPWGGSNHTWHAGKTGFYYGVFWAGMPDLNWRNPNVRQEMERIAGLWLRRGVDGFRLDATRHLVENGPDQQQVDQPETHAALKEFAAVVRAVKPEAILVGENWTDTDTIAEYYGDPSAIPGGDELPMSFDFPLAAAIVKAAQSGTADDLEGVLRGIQRRYPAGALDATFLTNHDMTRVATQLGGDQRKLRTAAAILLTLPGTPFLYYGEELGLENGPGGDDKFKRTPMPWDTTANAGFSTGKPWFDFAPGGEHANFAAESADPGSLLSHYRRLLRARKASTALREGTLEILTTADPAVFGFTRFASGEHVLVLHNLTGQPQDVGPIALPGHLEPLLAMAAASEAPTVQGQPAAWRIHLPPGASCVWRLRP